MKHPFDNKNKDSKKSSKSIENWRTLIDSDTVDLSKFYELDKVDSVDLRTKTIRQMKDIELHFNADSAQLADTFSNEEVAKPYQINKNNNSNIVSDLSKNILSEYMEEVKNLKPFTALKGFGEESLSKEEISNELSEIDSQDLFIQNNIIKTASQKKDIATSLPSKLKKSNFNFIPRESKTEEIISPAVSQKKKLKTKPVLIKQNQDRQKSKIERSFNFKQKVVSPGLVKVKKKETSKKEVLISAKDRKNKNFIRKTIPALMVLSFLAVGIFTTQKIKILKTEGQERAKIAYEYMQAGQEALFAYDASKAESNFLKAQTEFKEIDQKFTFFGQSVVGLSASFPAQSGLGSVSHLVNAGKLYSLAGYEASRALSSLKNLDTSFGDNQSNTYFTDSIVLAGLELKKADEHLKEANAEIAQVRPQDIPDEFEKDIRLLQSKTNEIEVLFEESFASLDVLLAFLGHNESKNYILVFQNNSELRSTGGFMGTYGILKLTKGGIEELFIDGIYNPDGQLKVNEFFVIPPEPLKYVTPYWGTRDANWFFDFPTSAEKIAWFYKQTGGPPPDKTNFENDFEIQGVIALNTNVLTKLLELSGPIEMEEYGTILDSDNWLEIVQQEVEQDYNKELNRPKQILADLTPILIERLGNYDKKIDIITTFLESLERKDILIYSRSKDVQEFMVQQGWSGSVNKMEEFSAETIKDYLAVVISNIGGWKTDIYTDTEVDTVTKISDSGDIMRTVTISRKHNGGSTPFKWYNKPNYGYLRIYTPKGSELISAEGFSKAPIYKEPDYEAEGYVEDPLVSDIENNTNRNYDTDIFEESGKTVFGNWLWVPAGERVLAAITYKLPYSVEKETSEYGLVIQKQSGIDIKYSGSIEEFDSALDITSCYRDGDNLGSTSFNFIQETDTDIKCSLSQ